MNTYILRAENLFKRYGRVPALRGVDFSVRPSAVTAFLGENGAGKTTTIKLLLGFLRPDSGRVEKTALRTGYVPERPVFFSWLTGKETLELTAPAFDLMGREIAPLVERLSGEIGFDVDLLGRRPHTYSPGNQKKFSYLQSLLIDPELLIVDEPLSSLDPNSIRLVRRLFDRMKNEGKTLLLSSHLISEMERMADDVIIIKKGRIVVQGDLVRLKAGAPGIEPDLESLFFHYSSL